MSYQLRREAYLMGRDAEFPTTEELEVNLARLVFRVNALVAVLPIPVRAFLELSSGYRPGKYNTAAGGSLRSAHLTCEAVDLKDPDQKVSKYLVGNPDLLSKFNLYMELPAKTPTWVHLDTRARATRIFTP